MRNKKATCEETVRIVVRAGILALLVATVGCGSPGTSSGPPPRPIKTFSRIGVVGASVSAGFGGVLLADAFTAAAPGARVTGAASVLMFRDAVANGAQ
jgi:hypothetical protein